MILVITKARLQTVPKRPPEKKNNRQNFRANRFLSLSTKQNKKKKNQETFSLLFSGLSVPAGLYLKRIYEEHGPEGVEAHLNNYLNQCEDEGYQPIEYIIGLGTGTRQEFINHIINQLALNKGQMEAPTTATPYNPEIGEDLTQPDSILSLLNTDDLFDVIYNCAHQSSEPTEDPRHS